MSNKRELSHKYLEGKTRYDYCPHCVREIEQEGISDWLSKGKLKPLKMVKIAESIANGDGTYREVVETHYECIKCGFSNIKDNIFVLYYCCRADGTKYNEPPKEPGSVWSMEKRALVPAKYNSQTKTWEEIPS